MRVVIAYIFFEFIIFWINSWNGTFIFENFNAEQDIKMDITDGIQTADYKHYL